MTIIAERRIDLGDSRGVGYARVFEAKDHADGGSRCDYEIAWPGYRHGHWTAGVDSWQAVEMAMRSIAADIAITDDFQSGRIGSLGKRLTTYEQITEFFGVRTYKALEQ